MAKILNISNNIKINRDNLDIDDIETAVANIGNLNCITKSTGSGTTVTFTVTGTTGNGGIIAIGNNDWSPFMYILTCKNGMALNPTKIIGGDTVTATSDGYVVTFTLATAESTVTLISTCCSFN